MTGTWNGPGCSPKHRRPKICSTPKPSINSEDNLRRHRAQADLLADLAFQRDVERVHRLGPRPLHELLVELGGARLIRAEIEDLVRRYARLDPEIVRALGADKFPPPPVHMVRP